MKPVFKFENSIFHSVFQLCIKLILLFASLFLVFIVLFLIDDLSFNDRITNQIAFVEDCSFVVPKEYKIVTDGEMFAVKLSNRYDEYLSGAFWNINSNYSHIRDPALFYSECKAKAYLKRYLKSGESLMKDFK